MNEKDPVITHKTIAIRLLYELFLTTYDDVDNYEDVDLFYADLGYDYELYHELPELGIEGTGDLQDMLKEGRQHKEEV